MNILKWLNQDAERYSDSCVYLDVSHLSFLGCEGDLAATSVTPLIARVDSADLAG